MTRKILLLGRNGQVGWELRRSLSLLGTVVSADKPALDLAQPDLIRAIVRMHEPHLIINAAAYTAVDKAEDDYQMAKAINGVAPGILAKEAKRIGATLIHYSTDYVFDGKKDAPYTEDDAPNPINSYGDTKLMGDRAVQDVGGSHLIFRTSWVYGRRGANFVRTILRLLADRDEISIVDDQIGSPTWCRIIAETTAQIMASMQSPDGFDLDGRSGIYNLTAHGSTSWYGFACKIADHARDYHLIPKVGNIRPIPSSEYPTPAQRPAYGVLDNTKLAETFGMLTPTWEEQLKLCLEPE
ncbi:MAG: dTDP-4-dehydrorhamnose reductase [Gammaproteobacteria bacterium]|nr:dTDP-4-dehydrorhamnose reductase [Gammaproteobacteria bacterium]